MTTAVRERTTAETSAPRGSTTRPALSDTRTLRGPSSRALLGFSIMAAFIAGGIWSMIELRINIASLIVGFENAVVFFQDRVGTLEWPELPDLMESTAMTLAIVLLATLLGAIISVILGLAAAFNTSPSRATRALARTFVVVMRAIPELILTIILIVIMGMGQVAGTLALALGAMGLLSKLVADSIEETDVRVQQAISTGGAGRFQVFMAATVRQAAPASVAHLFYQLDVNIRAATLLGIVGAGGVGYYLLNANRVLSFEMVTYILLMIFVVVLILEFISILMRRLLR